MSQQPLSRWAKLYVVSIALCGAAAIAHAAWSLYKQPIGWRWTILALLTLISGSATVRLASVPATISISETFVFTSVLLFGPAAGTLTVTLDALVISLWLAWRGHPHYRLVFNVTALPLALWLGAHLYYLAGHIPPLHSLSQNVDITRLLWPLSLFTAIYFLLNSFMIAVAIALEKHLAPFKVWKTNFAWLSLNYVGGASLAALLVSYTRNIDYAYLAALPLLVILYLTFAISMGRVEDANRHLGQLNSLYISTIETLAMAIDAKDQITHGHIRRVQQYAVGLAKRIGVTDQAQISAIEAASLLHDMGKLAIPEYILNKPGRLTPAEFDKMKLHASVGADILSAIPFPYPVVPIVRHHHENWDGSGYPDGLRGTDIPIGARILSVVDCFDALTSDRPYRPRLPDAEAIQILLDRRGAMYDPLVVDTFIRVYSELAPSSQTTEHHKGGISAISRGYEGVARPEHNTSSLDDISASTEEMLMLYDLARALAVDRDFNHTADIVTWNLRRMIPATTVAFFRYDSTEDDLVVSYATGEHATHFAGLRIPRGQRLTGWVAANQRTIVNSDPVLDLGESARALQPRLLSCLSTPLLTGNALFGVLSVYSSQRDAFTPDHSRVIEVISRQASQPLAKAAASALKSQIALRQRSEHELVAIDSSLQDSIASQSISSLSIIVALVTVSGVHDGKDSDRILSSVAEHIRPALRATDVIFRLGLLEFVVLLVQTDAEGAISVAQRIALARGRRGRNADTTEWHVSVGTATAPTDAGTLDDLIAVARKRQASDFHGHRPRSIH